MLTMRRMEITNIVLCILTAVGGLCYDISGILMVKCCASFCFLLLGGVNLIYGFRQKWGCRCTAVILVAGLLAGFLADIALEINFIQGAAVFAVGHILYFVAYCRLMPLRLRDLPPGAVIFTIVTAMMVFMPWFDFGGVVMQTVAVVYALLICAMWSKAHSNYRAAAGTLTKLLAIGSFLFLFSDFMLLLAKFTALPDQVGSFCINTYYPGQAVLAWSLLYMNKKHPDILKDIRIFL